MKRVLQVIFCGLCMFAWVNANAAMQTYTFDPMHTSVTWHVNHFGFSNPSGKWYANGTLMFDESAPQKSQVKVAIQLDSLDTGIAKFNEHILSAAFLDAKKYPVAMFVSNRVEVINKNTLNVYGVLDLHGTAVPITLVVTINQVGIHPYLKKQAIGVSAVSTIYRSDFGIKTYLPGVGDAVKLNIEAEAE